MKQFIHRLVISLSVLLFGMTGTAIVLWWAIGVMANTTFVSNREIAPFTPFFQTITNRNLLPLLLLFLAIMIAGFLLLVFYAAPIRRPRKPPLSPAERLYRFLDEINHASGPGDPPEP